MKPKRPSGLKTLARETGQPKKTPKLPAWADYKFGATILRSLTPDEKERIRKTRGWAYQSNHECTFCRKRRGILDEEGFNFSGGSSIYAHADCLERWFGQPIEELKPAKPYVGPTPIPGAIMP